MGLQTYRRKRNFTATSEPRGGALNKAARETAGAYVIQKHAARRLHYDLRLELDGVLKSWAVTRGPSLVPGEKRLAVEVEDHPLEYGDFEGTIPKGEYGGGTVIVWDRGSWTPIGDPHKGLKKGHLEFEIAGEKLHGRWHLVRMARRRGETRDNWLLIKSEDAFARPEEAPDILEEAPQSAKTGRVIDDVSGEAPGWSSKTGPIPRDDDPPEDKPSAKRAKPSSAGRSAAKSAAKSAPKSAAKSATKPPAKANEKPAPASPPPSAPKAKSAAKSKAKSAAESAAKSTGNGAPKADPASPAAAPLSGARKAAMPDFVPPMLATLAAKPPEGARFIHEIKFDGYRLQAHISAGKVRLLTRSALDWTNRFGADVPRALADLPCENAIIDGELVVEGPNGASDFSALQADLSQERSDRFVFYAFDLIYLDGLDLRAAPLTARKARLKALVEASNGPLRFSADFDASGEMVLRHACRLSLEGVVSKLADGPYRSGRGRGWIKSKCSARQEFVVGGYVPSTATKGAIGSLVLGVYEGDELVHVGRVGTGFTAQVARDLHSRLAALETKASPFADKLDATQMRGVRFVRPDLVAEVEFRAWTGDGHLRHAAFRGLREDKAAREITRERPVAAKAAEREAEGAAPAKAPARAGGAKSAASAAEPPALALPRRTVKLTHPDRLYWPDAGVTKEGLADYYAQVWRQIAPFIVGRPLALLRCPEGIGGQQFFQKHIWRGINSAIRQVKDPKKPGEEPLVAISDLDGLIALVQSAVLEIHPWGATLEDWERPDMIILDLDPGEGVTWEAVVAAALEVRARLEAAGLAAFVKTSGGKGLHVVAPLVPKAEWPDAKAFTKALAEAMTRDSPDLYVATITKAKRHGKVLVDYLRNQRGQTAVAAYSTRARPGAAVSMPLTWEELGPDTGPAAFTVANAPARLAALPAVPWADFRAAAAPLPTAGKRGR